MGTISRHANAPFADGETLSGSELERDFDTIYKDYNGNIDNSNIAAAAEIDGSKLANATVLGAKLEAGAVTEAKLGDLAVTTDKIAATAVTAAKIASGVFGAQSTSVSSAAGTTASTTSATLSGLSTVSLTPQSTSDAIQIHVGVTVTTSPVSLTMTLGASVDGTDYFTCQQYCRADGPTHVSTVVQVVPTSTASVDVIAKAYVSNSAATFSTAVSRYVYAELVRVG